jgi:hypothetical protein
MTRATFYFESKDDSRNIILQIHTSDVHRGPTRVYLRNNKNDDENSLRFKLIQSIMQCASDVEWS